MVLHSEATVVHSGVHSSAAAYPTALGLYVPTGHDRQSGGTVVQAFDDTRPRP